MFELTKDFRFEAAHTLDRRIDAEPSRRIHGHSYRAEVSLRGAPDSHGMVMDFGLFGAELARLRDRLDHRFLDDIETIGPATLENLCLFIWRSLAPACPNLARVAVFRDSEGESCAYTGPET
ncbi:6-carboxytetrahydropterin synthase [Acidiphilium sp. AL]|uniref:6-carboxy-5,6,7,8-tetrahydropterin synthase n=1 Tax=Acidiphilium iwatense TaxID=768198 RepID=A0ABS9E1Z0_9PROT|nr:MULTISPECIES: 6-carboxytetrahydropterin synthase [Acidiphilium]MCF3948425.1 6-carboxytetrahydropterin synthase [Acidiphilium iwatense]MCU4161659.1 6-carboxytetrahydropterin synthase [Acidiphilium sp. AL]